jgi:thiosulfate dehydrogenase [quinone] large subunit
MSESRIWAVLLRLAVGGVWVFEAYPQLATRDSYLNRGFVSLVQTMASGNPWHFYQQFLLTVVLPHASIFAYLTLVGNVAIGVCLFVGLLTPYAAAVAMLLNVNYALAGGWMDRMDYSLNAALFFAEIVVVALAAGRLLGIDAALAGQPAKRSGRRF